MPEAARFCPVCGASLQPKASQQLVPQDPLLGRKLDGKFLIEELLGVGGMGRVYRARQLSLDKVVCVKVLHAGMSTDPTLVGRFHREARAASRLNHPNSITVIDFGQDPTDGALYLAMEYIPGKDLGYVIREEFPLSEARIVHIMDQVLSALADAHAVGIIHRDLKPENIMVTDLRGTRDFVKVLDFGIAKIQEGPTDPGLTQVGMVCGTPEYMSPEQARGEELDARSDLYAAGVIMYQMVTGRLPFTAPTAMATVSKHLIEPPLPPSKIKGVQVSAPMEKLILRCLSKNRDGRPATALAMQQELASVLSPQTAVSRERPLGKEDLFPSSPVPQPQMQPSPTRPHGLASRGRNAILAGAVLALFLAAAMLYYFFGRPAGQNTHADAGAVQSLDASAASDAGAFAMTEANSPGPADAAGTPADTPAVEATTSQAVTAIPQAAEEFYTAGKEMMARNQTEKAISLFEQAVKIHPDYAAAHRALGMCHMRLGHLKAARNHFSRYLEILPEAQDRAQIEKLMQSL